MITGTHRIIDGCEASNSHSDVTLDVGNEIDGKDDETNDMLDYMDGYKAGNNHLDITLDNHNEIDDKNDGINDDKIAHMDDNYNLIASKKRPDEAQVASEEATKEIDIDGLINDMNKFLLSTELHITSGMLYKTDEIECSNNDETTNPSNIDRRINDTRKSFLSETTKDDPAKGISSTAVPYNDEYSPISKDIDYHHPSPDEIGNEWQAPDKHFNYFRGFPEHIGVTTALNLK